MGTERGNARGGATKKCGFHTLHDSTHLSTNSNFEYIYMPVGEQKLKYPQRGKVDMHWC